MGAMQFFSHEKEEAEVEERLKDQMDIQQMWDKLSEMYSVGLDQGEATIALVLFGIRYADLIESTFPGTSKTGTIKLILTNAGIARVMK